jgi:uncharacterized protein (TIGR03435 family)
MRTKIARADSRELLAVGIFGATSLGDRVEMLLKRGREFSTLVSPLRLGTSVVALLMLVMAASLAPRWIAFAQQPDRPSFEVATIKPGDPSDPRTFVGTQRGGNFFTINATAKMLIGFAYDVRPHQISPGPGWLDSDKFTIEAKPDSAVPIPRGPEAEGKYRRLAQSLLADRFKLAVHREIKEGEIYELVVSKNGPKLKEASDTAKPGPRGIGMRGRGHLTGSAAPLNIFVNTLSQLLGRPVVDKTGLKGKYDFILLWTPDPAELTPIGGPDVPLPPDLAGPSLFTALQEQLGLKLQSAKGPVEILVIDHVEKPDAN